MVHVPIEASGEIVPESGDMDDEMVLSLTSLCTVSFRRDPLCRLLDEVSTVLAMLLALRSPWLLEDHVVFCYDVLIGIKVKYRVCPNQIIIGYGTFMFFVIL